LQIHIDMCVLDVQSCYQEQPFIQAAHDAMAAQPAAA